MEKQKGSPPTWHDIKKNMHENDYEEFKNTTNMPILDHIVSLISARGSIVWEDKIYIDKSWNYFSLTKYNSSFHRFSERFEQNYAKDGYFIDEMKMVRPGPNTKTVDFG